MNYKKQLQEITGILLEDEDDYGRMKGAVDDLYRLLLTVSGMEEDNEKNREDIYLASGKAIGPLWAAACIKEIARTKRFLRGVYKGIRKAQGQFPERPIHILYAGTGPFATLAIPFTTVFGSSEIKFTFLEINDESIKYLDKVIKTFQIEDYVHEIVQCDAVSYKAGKNGPVHMIISETMQNALKREPQVAITMNLVPQMEKGGVLIPRCVEVQAVLLDPKKNMEWIMGTEKDENSFFFPLKSIFKLDKNLPALYPKAEADEACSFPEVEVHIPEDTGSRFSQLCLFTTIEIFDEEVLSYNQCSLTMPLKLFAWDKSIDRVVLKYVSAADPGFVCMK